MPAEELLKAAGFHTHTTFVHSATTPGCPASPCSSCVRACFAFKATRLNWLLFMQGEPGFERLKRELEDLKNAPRGLEGTYRTAAEMERHRAQAADAAIEEQLEVQTAFREHGAKLQGIYEVKQRTETEMTRREQEMKQLSSAPLLLARGSEQWLPLMLCWQSTRLQHLPGATVRLGSLQPASQWHQAAVTPD